MATCLVIITEPPLLLLHRFQWRPNFNLSLISPNRRSISTVHARWDSNAETVRPRKFGFDFKRRDLNDDGYEPNESDFDEDDDEEEEGFFRRKRKKRRWWSDDFDDGGIIEEAIDTFWVFKVFKAYGWFLPVILASWLLSSGPKAFLMALAFPLGQSVISMAFDKLRGGTKAKPKRQNRTRRKKSDVSRTDPDIGEQDVEEEDEEELKGPRKGKMGYQSWVDENENFANSEGRRETGFGGWDDLEKAKSKSKKKVFGSEDKGKLSRRGRKRDTPLFMRLLIAVFPFLGSWTNMLW